MSTMKVKLSHGEIKRRFNVEFPSADGKFDILIEKIHQLVPEAAEFNIFWTDEDGDKILIMSESELDEALQAESNAKVIYLLLETLSTGNENETEADEAATGDQPKHLMVPPVEDVVEPQPVQKAPEPEKAVEPEKPKWKPFHSAVLEAHNQYRSKHDAEPLKLSADLNELAQNWAQQIAGRNVMQHRDQSNRDYSSRVGENIWATFGGEAKADAVVDSWYNEVKSYGYGSGGFSMATGHFTQLVWKGSKELGVGIATNGPNTYVVCNYRPPGNYMGQFQENVKPPKGQQSRNGQQQQQQTQYYTQTVTRSGG